MQVRDKGGAVVKTETAESMKAITKKFAALDGQTLENASRVTIGKLPKKKDRVEINGLSFIVTYSDSVTGMLHMSIERPKGRTTEIRENESDL